MAKYSSANFSFQIADTDGSGGTLRNITSYITKLGDLNVNKGVIDLTPFGASSAVLMVGIFKKYDPFTIGGVYDDAASGPEACLNIGRYTHADIRKCTITIGGSRTLVGDGSAGGAWILDFKRTFNVGEYTGFEATLQLSGTITEN